MRGAILGCVAWLTVALVVSATPPEAEKETPVLWRDPGPLQTKDLYWGPGRADQAPRPPLVFVKEDPSGTKPKVAVIDANGMSWTAKFASKSRSGTEVHAEIAASRLLWAFGYFVEEHYFVAEGTITGVTGLSRRTRDAIASDSTFKVARFERRPPGISREARWDLDNNPFAGSRELSGLKILAMLLNNWDARLGNTAILRVPLPSGEIEHRYLLSDVGTAFGEMPGGTGRATRWNLAHYENSAFIRGVVGDTLAFCHGLDGAPPLTVPLDHAQWLSGLASQLTHAQARQAFEASGAEPRDVDGFSTLVMKRIAQLRAAVAGTLAGSFSSGCV